MVGGDSDKEIILEGVDYECDVVKRCVIELIKEWSGGY